MRLRETRVDSSLVASLATTLSLRTPGRSDGGHRRRWDPSAVFLRSRVRDAAGGPAASARGWFTSGGGRVLRLAVFARCSPGLNQRPSPRPEPCRRRHGCSSACCRRSCWFCHSPFRGRIRQGPGISLRPSSPAFTRCNRRFPRFGPSASRPSTAAHPPSCPQAPGRSRTRPFRPPSSGRPAQAATGSRCSTAGMPAPRPASSSPK